MHLNVNSVKQVTNVLILGNKVHTHRFALLVMCVLKGLVFPINFRIRVHKVTFVQKVQAHKLNKSFVQEAHSVIKLRAFH